MEIHIQPAKMISKKSSLDKSLARKIGIWIVLSQILLIPTEDFILFFISWSDVSWLEFNENSRQNLSIFSMFHI